jgi:hypothetical protein
MALNLWLKSLVSLGFVLILTSCIPIEDPPISPSDSTITDTNDASLENIISGETECDNPGNISSDGKYLCEGHGAYYWISIENLESEPSQNTSSNQDNGYWKNNCTYVDVPNPNYDARKGFSAWVNEPTIRTQQCSQIWVND